MRAPTGERSRSCAFLLQLLQPVPDPSRLVAARLRDEAQTVRIATSPAQGLAVAHDRQSVDLDQSGRLDFASRSGRAQLRAALAAFHRRQRIERAAARA